MSQSGLVPPLLYSCNVSEVIIYIMLVKATVVFYENFSQVFTLRFLLSVNHLLKIIEVSNVSEQI